MKHILYGFVGCLALLPLGAAAQVGKLSNPLINRGEWKVDYNIVDYIDESPGLSHDLRQRFELGYSFTEKWMGIVGSEWRSSESESVHTELVFFDLKREFTDQKDGWWLSTGARFEYVLNVSGDPDGVNGKLILQKEHGEGKFMHRTEAALLGEVGQGASDGVVFRTRWLSRWNAFTNFKPGFEWHAAWGNIDRFDSPPLQRQYLGPVAYGEVFRTAAMRVNYEIGYVFGLTDNSGDGALRFRIEATF
jgi:hypothetical protein